MPTLLLPRLAAPWTGQCLQRYRCRQCRRTFNDLTGTPLARLRLRDKWPDFLGMLLASRPVRAAANQLQVHRNTAFRWRHRFLDGVRQDRPACQR
jgi:transposase-like protein